MIQTHTPVDVICVCSACGKMRPLRFQVEDAAHQMVRVNIEEVVSIKSVTHVGAEALIYLCRAQVQGIQRLFELKYSVRSQTWSLFQQIF